ncbi:MAG: hypothetical protein ACRCVV_12905 [Shewanella sp.]
MRLKCVELDCLDSIKLHQAKLLALALALALAWFGVEFGALNREINQYFAIIEVR